MRSILLLLFLLASPARATWQEVTSDHFRIYADAREATVRDYAERLERVDAAMRALRKVPREESTANKLTIFALSGREAVASLFGKGGANVGGWYSPRPDGSVAFTPLSTGADQGTPGAMNPTIILLHEYAHHFFFRNSTGGPYPSWFVEGYAEFFSTAKVDRDGSVLLGVAAVHRAHELFINPISAADLLSETKALPLRQRGAMYGKGWLLIHYLIFNKERAGQIDAYLKGIGQGVAPAKAATAAFGDLRTLDAELRRYIAQRKLSAFRIPPERIAIGPIAVRQLSPVEEVMMPVHIRSRRGVDAAQARALVPLARRIAARGPESAPVQTWLAEAELDAGNLAEAEMAADRAVAAAPKDATALLFRARVAEARAAQAAPADRKSAWAEARRRIAAANRADPNEPGPLIDYYLSFRRAGLDPTPLAANALRRAAVLAPEALGLRLLLATQAVEEGKPAEARAALLPLAYAPHGGAIAEAAAKALALIDDGKAKEVAALLGGAARAGSGDDGGAGR